ncbi:MAG: Hsp20/alpha crystallin family protein [Patescibacteria group bacterium]|nr:Hsp20/alpha crystallin family protein [Patescibacteria group bacterium]
MKRSFLNRFAESGRSAESYDFDDDLPPATLAKGGAAPAPRAIPNDDFAGAPEGELPVDLYQTPNEIVVRAFIAGVGTDELDVSIRRDMVEIEGARAEREQIAGPDYFIRELFWGSFSRAISLPQEVDVEASSAVAKNGVLTIIMPKLDKARQTKLKVKAG